MTAYARPTELAEATRLLAGDGAVALAGGTDLVTRLERGKARAETLVDLTAALPAGLEERDGGLAIGAATTLADLARDERSAPYAALGEALGRAASPQLRERGTVGGNLAQHVRCWYYRHPDLTCWLAGGETCYAQIGDHRKHGIEPGDCISVAPSDLAAVLGALGATAEVAGPGGARTVDLLDLYGRPSSERRSALTLAPGEVIVRVLLPPPPDASAYERAGERQAWSFALCGIAAARRGDERRLVAIGLTNDPRLLDPDDPLAGLPGLEMTGWKRRLAQELCARALSRVA